MKWNDMQNDRAGLKFLGTQCGHNFSNLSLLSNHKNEQHMKLRIFEERENEGKRPITGKEMLRLEK